MRSLRNLSLLSASLLALSLLAGAAHGAGPAPAPAASALVWFDLETSGFSGKTDEIIQIAAIGTDADGGNPRKLMSMKVKPVGPVSAHAAAINHYTPQTWRRAVPVVRVLDALDEALKDGAQLAGHNVDGFDIPFLQHVYARAGRVFPAGAIQRTVDTMHEGKRLKGLGVVPDAKLGTLGAHFGVVNPKAHDALGDVATTVGVFRRMNGRPVEKLRSPRAVPVRARN